MSWALAVTIWVVTLLTAGTVALRLWWFPAPISELARRFDSHFALTLALCGFFFVLAQAALGYVVIR